MKWTATIKQIGTKAISPKDKMVILFDENVTEDLADVSIMQKFAQETPNSGFVFKKGDTVTIDGRTYVAEFVGPMVESNVRVLGHVTLFFNQKAPKDALANGIYFGSEDEMPTFVSGSDIIYEHI